MNTLLTLLLLTAVLGAPQRKEGGHKPLNPVASREMMIDQARKLTTQVEDLINRDEYDAAMPKAARALKIRERMLGPKHPEVASSLDNLAYILFRKKNYTKARELYNRALSIREKTGFENREAVRLLNNVGLLYHAERDRDAAERFYRRALAIQEKLPRWFENPKAGFVILNIAIVLLEKGDHVGAEPLFRRALKVMEEAPGLESSKLVPSLNYLAFIRLQSGNRDEALSLFKRALALVDKYHLHDPVSLLVVSNLLQLYAQEADHAPAEGLARRSFAMLEKGAGDDFYSQGAGYNSLAQFYRAKGDNKKAELFYGRAAAALEKVPEAAAFAADVLTLLGRLHIEQKEFAKAIEPLARALALRRIASGPEHENFATNLSILAHAHHEQGNYREAESLYQQALDIYLKTPGELHPYTATVINNMGVISLMRRDRVGAEARLQRALKIREQVLNQGHEDLAASLTPLARVYQETGRLDEAAEALRRALKIYEASRGPRDPLVAQMLNDLGLVYNQRREPREAEPLFRRALEINEERFGKDHINVTINLNNLALARESLSDPDEAERLYGRALAIYEKSGVLRHPDLARILGNFSELSSAKGDIDRAVSLAGRAAEIEDHYLDLMLAQGSESQNHIYWQTLSDSTAKIISLHTRADPRHKSAALLALKTVLRRKGRVLDAMADGMRSLRARPTQANKVLLDQLSAARSRLAARLAESQAGATGDPAVMARLEEDYRRLEAQVSGVAASGKPSPQVTIEGLQKLIPEGAALVEFVSYKPFDAKARLTGGAWGQNNYVAYVLRREGEVAWVNLGAAGNIHCDLWDIRAALRNTETRPEGKDVRTLARGVDEWLMRPVRKLLGDARQLLVSPDLLLQLVPFEALQDEQGHYLIETYSFTYLSSGRDLQRLQSRAPSRQRPVIVANPDFNLDRRGAKSSASGAARPSPLPAAVDQTPFRLLPGTEEEAMQIKRFLPGARIIRGSEATEAALKGVRGPSILHIATHGFFANLDPPNLNVTKIGDEEAFKPCIQLLRLEHDRSRQGINYFSLLSQSGIALAGANSRAGSDANDGILTAFEVGGLDLGGTKLVVLSACETGIGDVDSGNGLHGLRRALVLAGGESQVMSLWKVNDEATRDIMVNFYAGLRAGKGRGAALREAKLALLKSSNFSHPYFWAGFLQFGDWRALTGSQSQRRATGRR